MAEERQWDIELINDRKEIKRRLNAGPQLCMVLSKDIKPETLYNTVRDYYVFNFLNEPSFDEDFDFDAAPDEVFDSEELTVVLAGAYKGEIKEDVEKTKKAFGREVKEQIFDDLIHIHGIPYMPFCKDLDPNVIDTMRAVFDIRDIEHNVEVRTAVRCCYYDKKTAVSTEGKVISQSEGKVNSQLQMG